MDEVFWMLIFSIFASIFGAIFIFFKQRFKYWKKKGVSYLEPNFPLGNSKDIVLMRKTFGDVYANHYKKLEGHRFGGVYLMHQPELVLRDPDLIKAFLVKDFEHFHGHGFDFDESIDPLSGNLFNLTGMKWRELRTKLSPTFTSGNMKMMFQTLVDCGTELKEHVKSLAEEEEGILEVKDVLARYSTDIIASCAFGIQCNCLKNPDAEFRQWGKKIFEASFDTIVRDLLYTLVPSIAIRLKISSTSSDVTNFFRTMVHETVTFREKHDVRRNDFLQLLIQLKNHGKLDDDNSPKQQAKGPGMTMDELAAQVFAFFAAGFETSSATMSFCLYELALNPDIQERVRKEINTMFEKHGGNITYEGIQEMDYLDKVVSETLRKYPPLSVLTRECNKDYQISDTGVVIEKGIKIAIPVQALHYDPQYFPNPNKFDPHRFDEEVKSKRHHYVYLPFGEGPRICIGKRFGLMQTKVGLISLLSNYEFHVCNKTSIPLVMDPKQFVTAPIGGIWLQIKKECENVFNY